jgi:hypothetical protein
MSSLSDPAAGLLALPRLIKSISYASVWIGQILWLTAASTYRQVRRDAKLAPYARQMDPLLAGASDRRKTIS